MSILGSQWSVTDVAVEVFLVNKVFNLVSNAVILLGVVSVRITIIALKCGELEASQDGPVLNFWDKCCALNEFAESEDRVYGLSLEAGRPTFQPRWSGFLTSLQGGGTIPQGRVEEESGLLECWPSSTATIEGSVGRPAGVVSSAALIEGCAG
ncbi:hypothetical protein B296_00038612 [Ensete ventricosum]|uniref:Uncharacterized protein n=1 Tax=Ensete ventricosum TaxID=4639 RepID=A0A426YTX6_ENSVE|nr:hypothetical protein B296_00038612 [Ensete ventricosum]